MKIWLAVLGMIATTVWGASAAASVWDSSDNPTLSTTWLKTCQSSKAADKAECYSYFWGIVMDHMWMTSLGDGKQIGWCDRDGSRLDAKVAAWISYLKTHPDQLNGSPAAGTFFLAMKQTLPCQ
jgi:hypothetical protein